LNRLADVLGIDREELLAAYKREFSEKFSGAADRLPANRYALPMNRRRYIIAGSVILGLILVLTVTRSGFFGSPELKLTMPPAEPNPYIIDQQIIELKGSIDPKDTLRINGQEVAVAADGTFVRPYTLSPELNSIEFVVRRFLGKEIRVVRQVYYQGAATSTPAVSADSALEESTSSLDQ
jgi:hypothetical protein